jgi:hypothetical protein
VKVEELRAEAAWLETIASFRCPWPIDTPLDLSEYARCVLDDEHTDPTRSEIRRINQLIEQLKPAEERARLTRKTKRKEKETKRKEIEKLPDGLTDVQRAVLAAFTPLQENWRAWQRAGTHARKKASKHAKIVSLWQKLRLLPRERASVVASRVGVTAHYVRRVIRALKMWTNQC